MHPMKRFDQSKIEPNEPVPTFLLLVAKELRKIARDIQATSILKTSSGTVNNLFHLVRTLAFVKIVK